MKIKIIIEHEDCSLSEIISFSHAIEQLLDENLKGFGFLRYGSSHKDFMTAIKYYQAGIGIAKEAGNE